MLGSGPTMSVYYLIFVIFEALQEAAMELVLALDGCVADDGRRQPPVAKRPYGHNTPQGKLAGTPLAGGQYACLWLLVGDLDYLTK
eukprot:13172213-Heterocapsa_arctica.AAC.1